MDYLEESSSSLSLEEIQSVVDKSSRELHIQFPLPPHTDPSLCRDEFLNLILKPHQKTMAKKKKVVIKKRETPTSILNPTVEGMAIMKMIKERKTLAKRKESIFSNARGSIELSMLYYQHLIKFQKASVEFLSVRLRKQLETFLLIWPGEIIAVPHKLFDWSVNHFLHRQKVNQLYLGVIRMERSKHDLDCTKFCTDINEIIRLLYAINSDFRTDEDLCSGAIALMNDANYERNSSWLSGLDEGRELRKKLNLQAIINRDRLSSHTRQSGWATEIDLIDAYMPIEMRYQVNWLHSNRDQYLMALQQKEKVLQDEIDELNDRMRRESATADIVNQIYEYQIDQYRDSIGTWQVKLEAELEDIELEYNILNNHWGKAKDDLIFYKDQVEMFRRRISEVLELIEDEERESQGKRSRGSSILSRRTSAKNLGNGKKKKKY